MLEDFAIFDGVAYSLELLMSFERDHPLNGASSLGRLIMNEIKKHMMVGELPEAELKQ